MTPSAAQPAVIELAAEEPAVSFSSLSEDLRLHILAHLSAAKLLQVSSVCRQWAACSQSEQLWLEACRAQRQSKHSRFALTDARAITIAADPAAFRGWRKEYERAERDSYRDHFLSRAELSSLAWSYRRTADAPITSARFRFEASGQVSGHPSSQPFPWALQLKGRAVVVGPEDAPFPALHASRGPDWTWRLENDNVTLRELDGGDPASSPPPGADTCVAGAAAADAEHVAADAEYVAVMLDGEVYYIDPSDVEQYEMLGATMVG